MSLSSSLVALAARVATEFNSVRAAISGKVDSTDTRLSDQRTPTDGSVTNAKIAGGAAIDETKLALASDAAAGIASRRTLGTGATQAAPGNHTHAGSSSTGTFNVKDYGAVGNGTTDDLAAINSTIAAALAAPGGRVLFPPGTYATTAVIDIPENVTLEGVHGDTIPYVTSPPSPCVIKPLATHTGTAIMRMRGKAETSRTYDHVGARIRNLTLDGTNTPAHTLGVQVIDLVREAELDHVTVNAATDTAFSFDANGSAAPQSLRILHCLAKASGWNGFKFSNVPDSTIIDCNSLGAANDGFSFQGFMNGQIANARAEWSGRYGVYFTSGSWGNGQGSGGCIVSSVTTDRNGAHGCYIDATGAGVLQINGMVNRRDGRNNGTGGGGYAGFAVASTATMPVIVDNLQVYPGVDDDGTGTNSPQLGVYAPGTDTVTINSGYVFAATTAIFAGSGCLVDPKVGTATGSTGSPTRVTPIPVAPLDAPTFTTSVTLPGNPSSALQAAPKQYVDAAAGPASVAIPTGIVRTTVPRNTRLDTTVAALVSGRLTLVAVYLAAGDVISTITFFAGSTAAGTPTNQWFSLYSSSLGLLGVTADNATTAWAGNGAKTLPLAAPYTATTSGLFYVGITVVATTVPTMTGATHAGTAIVARPPVLAGGSTTGLTNPASAPATAASPTPIFGVPYVELS